MPLDEHGPTIREYIEVRLNLLQERLDATHLEILTSLTQRELRYQQRWEATEAAIGKADNATQIRFESVNEFRAQLGDQSRTFMPRKEVEVMVSALQLRLDVVEKSIADRASQRHGIGAGWAAAVGVVGLVAAVLAIALHFVR